VSASIGFAAKKALKGLWQLARDLSKLEKEVKRELGMAEIIVACGKWYRLSQPFLEPAKTDDLYPWGAYLSYSQSPRANG
jgi:hypothetical protein